MTSKYALIMAGGAGTRLWPLSRKDRPKPLLPLVDIERSMFQISVERLYPLFSPEEIFVVANEELTKGLREQAPDLPEANFIVEPLGRNTGPAVGLGAIHVRNRDPGAVMVVLTADHFIADVITFRRVLDATVRLASSGSIITLGIQPTFAATGFGYIERGEKKAEINGIEAYDLKRFAEKPNREAAEAFLSTGCYSWNSGMFIWPVQRVMSEFAQHAPDIYVKLERIAAAIGTSRYTQELAQMWPEMRSVSVDFALMEHVTQDACVIPVDMGWSDIGNFETLYHVLSPRGENVSVGPDPLLIDTHRTLVYSKRLVATIGVEDLIIVDTDDIVLVCRRDQAQDVRQLVERLQESGQYQYL